MCNIARPSPFQIKLCPTFPFSKATSVRVHVCLTVHLFLLHQYLCIFLLSPFQRKSCASYGALMHMYARVTDCRNADTGRAVEGVPEGLLFEAGDPHTQEAALLPVGVQDGSGN